MITITNLTKRFENFEALSKLDMNIKKGSIYGLVGTNGAGKTTVIKHVTGVLRGDSGEVMIDGAPIYNNVSEKKRIGYVQDELYFLGNYSFKEMGRFYKNIYKTFNEDRFKEMVNNFDLDLDLKLSKFSKGMQKQAAFILTLCTMPDYLILDEPIDGLDPIIRKLVWKYIVKDVSEREMTVLVSSHNLREMEDICDSIGIISKGRMIIERDLDELKSDIHKVQAAFKDEDMEKEALKGLKVVHKERRGSVGLYIIRDKREKVEKAFKDKKPLVFDMLPLSLEEIFIYEMGGGEDEIEAILS